MTRDEFLSLPPALQMQVLLDVSPTLLDKLRGIEAPKRPQPPKYDQRIFRKGGMFVWASECDLESLRYWHNRATETTSPEFAERNAKDAKGLRYWIEWRRVEPFAVWSGERFKVAVTAKAPSAKPDLHQSQRDGAASDNGHRPASAPKFDDDGEI